MTLKKIANCSKEDIRKYIDELWSPNSLWDGSAGNAYVSVEVLGASLEEVKNTLAELATKEKEVADILENNSLYLHEDSISNTGYVRMAYWKGSVDFADTLSAALPGKIVVCEDNGWYGYDYCVISINGHDAIPGKDYEGYMEYNLNPDYIDKDDEEIEEEEQYYEVNLTITDKNGNETSVGGGMISFEDIEGYKTWANVVKEISSFDRDSDLEK